MRCSLCGKGEMECDRKFRNGEVLFCDRCVHAERYDEGNAI